MTIDPKTFDKDPLTIMREMEFHLACASDEIWLALFLNDQLNEIPVYGLTMDKADAEELTNITARLDELSKKYRSKTDTMKDECKEA